MSNKGWIVPKSRKNVAKANFDRAWERAHVGGNSGWGGKTPTVEMVRRWIAFSKVRISELGAINLSDWTEATQAKLDQEAFLCELMSKHVETMGAKVPTMADALEMTGLSPAAEL